MEDLDGPDELRQLVEDLTVSGLVLTKDQLEHAYLLDLSLQHVSRARVERQIDRNRERPMMYMYQNDGWGDECARNIQHHDGRASRH